jgi:hypothetical protein
MSRVKETVFLSMITDFKKYVKRTSRLYFAYVIHKGVIILSSAGLF